MSVVDSINARYGPDKLTVAAAGKTKDWLAQAGNKTPCYMTRWSDLPKAWRTDRRSVIALHFKVKGVVVC